MSRNVLAWIKDQVGEASHALVLTHNISFVFVQAVLLPWLRSAGNPRLTIFADAACATNAWREEKALLDELGVRYRVVPVELGSRRRFHPKAIILANAEQCALAIGSGNLTHGGMGANRELWTFSASGGEGGGRIAAFREYVSLLTQSLPISEPLKDAVNDLFDPTFRWVQELPPASGLAGTPNSRTLLDQLSEYVGDVRAITLLAPYYDDRGEALAEIARRYAVPVRALLQPDHVGLWTGAAAELPANVQLQTVDDAATPPAFIHAKAIAFEREHDVLLAVGSANCSRAALLSSSDAGNAELIAYGAVPHEVAQQVFDALLRQGASPALPEAPPSTEWPDEDAPALRIFAARQEAGKLEIAFRAGRGVCDLKVVCGSGQWTLSEEDRAKGVVRLEAPLRVRIVSLYAQDEEGQALPEAEAWVDDEASLAAPASLRRVLRRLADNEEPDGDPARTFNGVLEVFRDYLRDPEAVRRRVRRSEGDGGGPPQAYDPGAVFSGDFGSVGLRTPRGASGEADHSTSLLAMIEAFFSMSREAPQRGPSHPNNSHDPETEEDAEGAEETLLPKKKEISQRLAVQLTAAVKKIEEALLEPSFVATRSPRLIGGDLALAAVLLVKGVTDGLLQPSMFNVVTRRLWSGLFFGPKGDGAGSLGSRLSELPEGPERDQFIAELASPRLTAALTLWCAATWFSDDPEAPWFRLSAAQLYDRKPWLFASASPEVVVEEIEKLASTLLPSRERQLGATVWIEIVRSGTALASLCLLLKEQAGSLRHKIKTPSLDPHDLVWGANRLGFPTERVRRDDRVKGRVQFLGGETSGLIFTGYLLPLHEVLEAGDLDLPDGVSSELRKLIGPRGAISWRMPAAQ